MTDRERIIRGLEQAKSEINPVSASRKARLSDAVDDAISLLKEHEPAFPTWSQGRAYCGKCGQRFPRKSADREINYCSYCGKAVKWE